MRLVPSPRLDQSPGPLEALGHRDRVPGEAQLRARKVPPRAQEAGAFRVFLSQSDRGEVKRAAPLGPGLPEARPLRGPPEASRPAPAAAGTTPGGGANGAPRSPENLLDPSPGAFRSLTCPSLRGTRRRREAARRSAARAPASPLSVATAGPPPASGLRPASSPPPAAPPRRRPQPPSAGRRRRAVRRLLTRCPHVRGRKRDFPHSPVRREPATPFSSPLDICPGQRSTYCSSGSLGPSSRPKERGESRFSGSDAPPPHALAGLAGGKTVDVSPGTPPGSKAPGSTQDDVVQALHPGILCAAGATAAAGGDGGASSSILTRRPARPPRRGATPAQAAAAARPACRELGPRAGTQGDRRRRGARAAAGGAGRSWPGACEDRQHRHWFRVLGPPLPEVG